ncbi:hypothetical protein JCM3770_004055 [Rhodotorula araucariae]
MEHAHAHEHARLHRRVVKRQDRTPFAGVQSSLAGAGDDATDALPAPGAGSAALSTSTRPAQTTSAQPAQQSTPSSAPQAVIESTSSLAPAPSSTTAAPVETTSSTAAPVPTTTSTPLASAPTTSTTTAPTISSSRASSTTEAADDTSLSSSIPTTSESSSTLAPSEVPSTTVVIVSGSLSTSTSTSSSALASASNAPGGGSSGITTGGVVGIVAGAVVGIIAIVGIAVWFFKKKWQRDDDDQVSPFDREEFRRASVMLDDVDEHYAHSLGSYRGGPAPAPGGHSPQMSEYSMHDVSGLGRSNTLVSNGSGGGGILPGLARGNTLAAPRPPTMIGAHYTQYGAMPSFQPGQVVPSMPPQAYAGMDLYGATGGAGPYAAAGLAPYGGGGPGLDRSLTSASAGAWRGGDLSRNNSQASAYSQASDAVAAYVPAALRPGGSGHGHGAGAGAGGYPDERPLSLVHEDDEPYSPARAAFPHPANGGPPAPQSRSGTPTNANVQQTFFEPSGAHRHPAHDAYHHAREESLDAFRPRGGPAAHAQQGVVGQAWSDEDIRALALAGHHQGAPGEKRERRLSVRNGGLDAFDDDEDAGAYGGMH